MQRRLLARERGEDVSGLDDMLSERWTTLSEDASREFRPSFCELLTFIDVELSNALLILCGGAGSSPPSTQGVGILRHTESGKIPAREPLIFGVFPHEGEFTCGRWFPFDPAIFVTGSAGNGEILAWDTEQFVPAATFSLGRGEVNAVEMSRAPGANSGLIAAGLKEAHDVVLIDMASGASTHRLQMHRASVKDIAWAPMNPNMLASVDCSGQGCLFDIRRSGRDACIAEFNQRRRLPIFDIVQAKKTRRGGTAIPRERLRGHSASISPEEVREDLLGLRCVWNDNSFRLKSKGRLTRMPPQLGNLSSNLALSRVRFTPDGTTVVIGDRAGAIRIWDVLTGLLMRTHDNTVHSPDADRKEAHWKTIFEITPDGLHILSFRPGYLLTIDLEEGTVVAIAPVMNGLAMNQFVLHPKLEEAYSVHGNILTCWSPPG